VVELLKGWAGANGGTFADSIFAAASDDAVGVAIGAMAGVAFSVLAGGGSAMTVPGGAARTTIGTSTVSSVGGKQKRSVHVWNVTDRASVVAPALRATNRSGNVTESAYVSVRMLKFGSSATSGSGALIRPLSANAEPALVAILVGRGPPGGCVMEYKCQPAGIVACSLAENVLPCVTLAVGVVSTHVMGRSCAGRTANGMKASANSTRSNFAMRDTHTPVRLLADAGFPLAVTSQPTTTRTAPHAEGGRQLIDGSDTTGPLACVRSPAVPTIATHLRPLSGRQAAAQPIALPTAVATVVTDFFPNRDGASDPLLERLRVATVGLYDVAGEIGRGGMAAVYIATDLRLGRKVAIKVMEPRLNFTPGMAERFLQEARIAAQLQHHNIIVVHEVQQDGELIFFVMRVVEGGSLDEICRRLAQQQRKLPIDQAQWILWQSARALAYAHSEGIIHRDVKPANILVSTKGEVVVTDFGIARAVDTEGLTKSGMAIGTPTYMSPEQFVGQDPLSGASDQYALGIAAFEMLTGAPPFTGDLYRIIAAHGATPAPDIRERRPDCPDALADAVMRMLAKSPGDRWPSLDAVLPVLGRGLAIDGSSTRADLATVATELQAARAASVAAWTVATPITPWGASGSRRGKSTRPVPAAITVSPPNAQVAAGKQLHLRAVVTTDTGNTIADAVVRWATSAPAVATVAGDGTVNGVASGSATISAEVAGREGAPGAVRAVAELLVIEREVARVLIREGDQSIEGGEACRLTAELFDEDGTAIEAANVQWASSRPEVVHVDERGTVLALGGGQAIVSARVGGVQASVRVEVREAAVGAVQLELDGVEVEVGAVVPMRLLVTDISGLPRSDSGLVVVSNAPDVAEVQTNPLALMARAPGRAWLQVLSSENSTAEPWATAELEVRPAPEVVAPLPEVVPAVGAASPEPAPAGVEPLQVKAPSVKVVRRPDDAPEPPQQRPATRSVADNYAAPGELQDSKPSAGAVEGPGTAVRKTKPRRQTAVVGSLLIIVSFVVFKARQSEQTTPNSTGPTIANTGSPSASSLLPDSGNPVARGAEPQEGGAGTNVENTQISNRSSTNSTDSQPASTRVSLQSPRGPAQGRGRGVAPAGAQNATTPSAPVPRVDSAIAVAPPPPKSAEPASPGENDMRRLAPDYVQRLVKGEFRTGSLASFFSGATSSHGARMLGQPRSAGRDGDALLVDVDLEIERTMGSGAQQKRETTVRLVLRARSGGVAIESATPGAVRNAR